MTIKAGDRIPSIIMKKLTPSGMQDYTTDDVFAGKKVVVFALPGAFTPTCSARHLPSYVNNLPEFKALGVDVACLSVNDPFVMSAWADMHKAQGIEMLADGNCTLTKALGIEMDGTAYALGTRAQRCAMYVENCVVRYVVIEKPGAYEASSAEAMLSQINSLKAAA